MTATVIGSGVITMTTIIATQGYCSATYKYVGELSMGATI